MNKDEALRLALEALEDLARYENPQTMIQIRKKDGGSIVTMYPHKVASDAITAIKAALEAKDELVCVCGAVWEGQELVIAPKEEAKDEIDWKDMYEKQKRHSEMWVAKYEKDIGPLEKAVPHQEKNEFNPDWDTQAVLVEEIQRMAKRIEELEAQRTWVGLTDEEKIIMSRYDLEYAALIGEVERKLKELNT